MGEVKLCLVCAWREFCQKKFQISRQSGKTCPDFTRDLSIKEDNNLEEKDKQELSPPKGK